MMEAIVEITNAGENWKNWPDKKITVTLTSTIDPPVNGKFTTNPDGLLSSANPKDYYRWEWDAKSQTLLLKEVWPNSPDTILVRLSGVSLPFKNDAKGSGTLVAPNKARQDQSLSWKYKQEKK